MDIWALVAGVLALSSVSLSLYEVSMHMHNFTKPYLQRYIIRILLMVPIYSLNAWFAMLVPASGLYLDSLREVYESFVIYSFMKYLMNFLNYETNLQQYIDYKLGPNHMPPLCFLPTCIGGQQFFLRCKHGIIQYVIVRPITTFVAFISQEFGFYGEGNYNPLSGFTFPVLLLVNNVSQLTSMYSLAIFYTGYRHELDPMRPLTKFFTIKLVVFFSFFQSVVVAVLLEFDAVRHYLELLFPAIHDKVALGRRIQEVLICLDMLMAAMGHLYAFTYKPFSQSDSSDRHRSLASAHSISGPIGGPQSAWHNERNQETDSSGPRRNYFGTLCSILDFSEDKNDLSEHFSQIHCKMMQMLSWRRARLPSTVVQETAGGSRDGDRGAARGEGKRESEREHPSESLDGRQLSADWLVDGHPSQTVIEKQPARVGDSGRNSAASNIRCYDSL